MANSSVPITAGSGTEIDTRTTTTDTNHRQVVVLGDPATDAGVSPVDATSGLKVNLGTDNDVTNTVLSVVGGGAEATAQRVTIANDSTGVLSVDDNAGSLTVDQATSSNLKTEPNGNVASGATDSGNPVKVGGKYNTNGLNLSTGQRGDLQLNSNGSLRTTLTSAGFDVSIKSALNDTLTTGNMVEAVGWNMVYNGATWSRMRGDTNGIDISDISAGTQTNDLKITLDSETVEVVQDTAADLNVTEASAATIAGDTTSIDGKITACNTGAVTISAALPAGTNAIGKLAANSGVDIGDVDVTSIANGSINGPAAPTIDSYTQFAINLNAGANQVLVSSAASKQIWVYSVSFTCSVAGTVSFQDEDDTAITGIMDFAANSGLGIGASGNFAMPLWKLATDKDLEVDVVDAAIDGWISYAIVSV